MVTLGQKDELKEEMSYHMLDLSPMLFQFSYSFANMIYIYFFNAKISGRNFMDNIFKM